MKTYKTQTSVIRDFQSGIINEEKAKEILHKIIQMQKINKELKLFTKRLNQAALKAGFKTPNN